MQTVTHPSKTKKYIRNTALTLAFLFALNVFLFLTFNRPADQALFIDPVTHFATEEKVVALTFDDGPGGWTTPLLDLFAQENVKATFFVNGVSIEKHPQVAERALQEGHQLATHTYNHDRMIYKTPDFIQEDINKMDTVLQKLGVEDVGYFRPPFGDKLIVLPIMLNINHKKLITWNVDPLAQYEQPLNPDLAVSQVLEQLKPGSIIVLHDGRDSDPTAFITMMTKMIKELKAQGYSFVTVEEGLNKYGQGS